MHASRADVNGRGSEWRARQSVIIKVTTWMQYQVFTLVRVRYLSVSTGCSAPVCPCHPGQPQWGRERAEREGPAPGKQGFHYQNSHVLRSWRRESQDPAPPKYQEVTAVLCGVFFLPLRIQTFHIREQAPEVSDRRGASGQCSLLCQLFQYG